MLMKLNPISNRLLKMNRFKKKKQGLIQEHVLLDNHCVP